MKRIYEAEKENEASMRVLLAILWRGISICYCDSNHDPRRENKKAYVQVSWRIVYDSIAENEYQENRQ